MKKRDLYSLGLAGDSIELFAAAAIIIRMLAAIVNVYQIGSELNVFSDVPFSDVYSVLILFLAGAFTNSRHIKLAASVNLMPIKRVLSITAAAVTLSLIFAMFDMILVKVYFDALEPDLFKFLSWEELIIAPEQSLCGYGSLLLFRLTAIYASFFISGYSVNHAVFSRPYLIAMWILLFILFDKLISYHDEKTVVISIIVMMVINLLAYLTASPPIWGITMMFYINLDDITLSVIGTVLAFSMIIASAIRLQKISVYRLPIERRKEVIL